MKIIKVLGIETSCDETAVAIVDSERKILSNQVYSQIVEHKKYMGVVPEIAARAHAEKINDLIKESLQEAKTDLTEIDAIAVTSGPGLVGGLIVGMTYAKTLSYYLNKPLIEINHLEAHLLTVRITENLHFPFLSLLISGGHSQIVETNDIGDHNILGTTLDDAIGEAFDKVGKLLNLDYPCGPQIEKLALMGKHDLCFPVPLKNTKHCNFSLSGLKTAVRNYISDLNQVTEQIKADICYSFQISIGDMIENRLLQAFDLYSHNKVAEDCSLVASGGVASNLYIRERIIHVSKSNGFKVFFPPKSLCTDNAVMIAWSGIEKYKRGTVSNLDVAPKSKWPLSSINRI